MKQIKKILLIGLIIGHGIGIYAQDSLTVNISADIENQFVNRGQLSGGNSFQIQPIVYANYKNFELGAWGSYGLTK